MFKYIIDLMYVIVEIAGQQFKLKKVGNFMSTVFRAKKIRP